MVHSLYGDDWQLLPTDCCVLQVTVWAGVFPIVVSWWAAVALTAFIVAQFLVTSYCRNRKHLKPLWFNSVSNNILWFTFVKVGVCTATSVL